MWTWSKLVRVKQLEYDLVLSDVVLLLMEADKDRLVIVSNIDEGLRFIIPEEHAEFSSFVSFDPEPS